MQEAPDLLLVLRDYGFVSIKNKQPVLKKRREIAGTHHPDGVFFAFGPGIKQGAVVDTRNITDVGALLLYSLGLAVPTDFEGQVPEEIFLDQYLLSNPVVVGAATKGQGEVDQANNMSDEEKEKLMAQLKMLGYM
jgi:hypothetical protein